MVGADQYRSFSHVDDKKRSSLLHICVRNDGFHILSFARLNIPPGVLTSCISIAIFRGISGTFDGSCSGPAAADKVTGFKKGFVLLLCVANRQ